MTIPSLNEIKLLVHGQSCLDLNLGYDDRAALDNQQAITNMVISGGGMAANAAVAASRLGTPTGFSGRIGNDPFGQYQLSEFHWHGVNTELVEQGGYLPSLFLNMTHHNSGQSDHSFFKTPDQTMSLYEIPCQPALIFLDGEHFEVACHLIELARLRAIPVVLDGAFLSEERMTLLPMVDMAIISHDFTEACMESKEWPVIVKQLAQHCPRTIITLDDQGCIWHWQGEQGGMGIWPVHSIDGLGAGDAFQGAFCHGLIHGLSFHDNLRFASAAGALCSTRIGTRAGLPDLQQINAFMQNNPEPTITLY